ncbi:hypothetical protein BRADI_1g67055v3 [Brachypodium distachyon]|uniref:Uncharacterized protein n=1 Tax=Brachypodium distachyon TaxID=15368 RepID=A0A2K2DTT1_BRADI|nr:hypothetical protein BRADI_1g67055v3 [Brachypodium distachyon]
MAREVTVSTCFYYIKLRQGKNWRPALADWEGGKGHIGEKRTPGMRQTAQLSSLWLWIASSARAPARPTSSGRFSTFLYWAMYA